MFSCIILITVSVKECHSFHIDKNYLFKKKPRCDRQILADHFSTSYIMICLIVPLGNLYGRGASDNKAPVLAWIHAVEAYQALNMVRETSQYHCLNTLLVNTCSFLCYRCIKSNV